MDNTSVKKNKYFRTITAHIFKLVYVNNTVFALLNMVKYNNFNAFSNHLL